MRGANCTPRGLQAPNCRVPVSQPLAAGLSAKPVITHTSVVVRAASHQNPAAAAGGGSHSKATSGKPLSQSQGTGAARKGPVPSGKGPSVVSGDSTNLGQKASRNMADPSSLEGTGLAGSVPYDELLGGAGSGIERQAQQDEAEELASLFGGAMPKEEIGALRFLKVCTC